MSLALAILLVLAAVALFFAVQLNVFATFGPQGVDRPGLTRWLRRMGLALLPFGALGSVVADKKAADDSSPNLFLLATFTILTALIFNELVASRIGIGRRGKKEKP